MHVADLVQAIAGAEREAHVRIQLRDAMLDVPYQLAEVFLWDGGADQHRILYWQLKDSAGTLLGCGPRHEDARLNVISKANHPLWKPMRHDGYFHISDIRDRNNFLGEKDDYLLKSDNHYALLEQLYSDTFVRSRTPKITGLKDVTFYRLRVSKESGSVPILCFRFFNAIDPEKERLSPDITERILRLQAGILIGLSGLSSPEIDTRFDAFVSRSPNVGRSISFLAKAVPINELIIHSRDKRERELWAHAIHSSRRQQVGSDRSTKSTREIAPGDFVCVDLSEQERAVEFLFSGKGTDVPPLVCDTRVRTIFIDLIEHLSEVAQEKLIDVFKGRRLADRGIARETRVPGRTIIVGTAMTPDGFAKDGRIRDALKEHLMLKAVILPPYEQRRDDLGNIVQGFATHLWRIASNQQVAQVEIDPLLRDYYARRLLQSESLSEIEGDLREDIEAAGSQPLATQQVRTLKLTNNRRRDETGVIDDDATDPASFEKRVFQFFLRRADDVNKNGAGAGGKKVGPLDVVENTFARIAHLEKGKPALAAKLLGISIHTFNRYFARDFGRPPGSRRN